MGEVTGNETFEKVCDRSGIAEEFRGPDHVFIDEAPDGVHYAIPKEITINRPDGSYPAYALQENGAAVALDANVDTDVEL